MIHRLIVFPMCLMIFMGASACSTPPKFNFPQGTRVGIINLLEPYATHQQFSSLTSDNFKKTYDVDWDMPSYAADQLKTQLEKSGQFSAVKIKLSEPQVAKTLRLKLIEQILVSPTAPTVSPSGARLLEQISEPYDVQVVILIGSYAGPSPYRRNTEEPISVEGYGLFTRWLFGGLFCGFLSFRKAYAYAQIGVVVYKRKPVTYLGAARAIRKGRPLRPINDFDWDANIRNLPPAELNKTKPLIQGYIDEAVKRALRITNLTPSRPSTKNTGIGGAPSR